ncbi:Spy/CpxP family protein refolding chaperone [Phenylobacterium sp. VNQ135]|uniref:Spy/CpxP family protein refolding chaperone n=1 Tax=Phenylobacterium sp. VNQ135 TaxID=3400922 RepID=UPI003C0AFDC8
MKKTLAWLLAGAAVAATAGAAIAQDATADRARQEAHEDSRMQRHVHVYRSDDDDRRERGPRKNVMIYRSGEGREQHLKDVLQLRPNQEPALKAFLEATRPEHGEHHVVKFEKGAAQKPTSERLAEMEAKADEHHAAMKKRIAATRTFYAQLDEKQKKAFDAMPMLMMAGPGFGPTMIPIGHHMPMPPMPPAPPPPPAPPAPPGDI